MYLHDPNRCLWEWREIKSFPISNISLLIAAYPKNTMICRLNPNSISVNFDALIINFQVHLFSPEYNHPITNISKLPYMVLLFS